MTDFMSPSIHVVELHSQFGETWSSVHVGDCVSYPDGTLYLVETRLLEDKSQVSLLMRVIVPPELGDYNYGDEVMLSATKNMLIPEGIVVAPGNRTELAYERPSYKMWR